MKRTKNVMKYVFTLMTMLLLPLGAVAQNQTVKGTITDREGPVIGVTVKVKGSSTGTVTDLDGNYTISVPRGASLEFSYVGYNPQTVKVGTNARIDITLTENAEQLSEVVVVGYGTMKRSDLTGAVTSVGDKAIAKSIPTSIDQVLLGPCRRCAGTGQHGYAGRLVDHPHPWYQLAQRHLAAHLRHRRCDHRLVGRRQRRLQPPGLDQPQRHRIDGHPQGCLRHGHLWLACLNGVIMITTKKGQAGEATVTYDGYVGWQQMPKKLEVMNLREYAEHNNAIADAQIKNASSIYVRPDLLGEGTDWQDELFRNALMTSHNLSMNGGNNAVTYAFSAGYLNQDGIVIGSGYRRQTLRGSTDAQIKKWLKGGFSFSLADSKQTTLSNSYSIILTALRSQPTVAVKSPDGSYDGPDDQWMPENPVALAEITQNYNKKQNFRVNGYLEATLMKGLTYKTELSADYNNNKYYYYMPDYKFGIKSSDTRTSSWTATNGKYWSWRNILTYDSKFGRHAVNAMVGQEMSHNHYETQVTSATGFPRTPPPTLGRQQRQLLARGLPGQQFAVLLLRSRLLQLRRPLPGPFTLRRDGSSNFADGHRWGWFPSAALAWRVSQEDFLKDITPSTTSSCAGMGATGNQNVEKLGLHGHAHHLQHSVGRGCVNGNNANPDLKWETTYSYNAVSTQPLRQSRGHRLRLVLQEDNDLLMRLDLPAFLGRVPAATTVWPATPGVT
jgi:hypothetical protein